MPIYLFYMIDCDSSRRAHTICVSETFHARDDLEAVWTAQAIFAVCDDVCEGYWLWAKENRLVATSLQRRTRVPRKYLSAFDEQHQQKVLSFIKLLRGRYDFLAHSEKLVTETRRLRHLLEQQEPPFP